MTKILIVEDEIAIAELLQIGLTRRGYASEYVLNGREAADLIENINYDLILLDIMLPEINGYELMEYIETMNIPTIFITAKGALKDKVKGLRIGADEIENHILRLENDIKNREEFISDFSHELKTPMTSIMGYSRLLMTDDCDKELQKKSANYIYSECKRLELLSRKLLKLMEIDEIPIELVSIHTEWLKEKINIIMKPLIDNNNLIWINEWETCFIKGDGQLLLDLLKNLVENGIKASEKNIYISINGVKKNDKYIISVTDRGCGIEDSQIEKIVNPFYIIDKSRSKNQGNTGLGLSICDKIAKLHNSNLEIKSELKKGTTISIILEVENEE